MALKYWRGCMDWPLESEWRCETCGDRYLIWGLIHAQCRCDTCHTEYRMRNSDQQVVMVPICGLKDKYKEPARILWKRDSIPLNEITDEAWDSVMVTE